MRKKDLLCLRVHFDHVLPYSFCFNNATKNFVGACQICNGIKGDKVFKTIAAAVRYVRDRRIAKRLKNKPRFYSRFHDLEPVPQPRPIVPEPPPEPPEPIMRMIVSRNATIEPPPLPYLGFYSI